MIVSCLSLCCEDCLQFASAFADLSQWSQETGTWSASGGRAVGSDPRAVLSSNELFGHPYRLAAKVYPQPGGRYRVAVAYQDLDNYLFVEVDTPSDSCKLVRLGVVVGGDDQYLDDPIAVDDWIMDGVQLYVCWADGAFGVAVQRIGQIANWPHRMCLQTDVAGYYGYGTESDSGVALEVVAGAGEFADVEVVHHKSGAHPTCPRCQCSPLDCAVARDSFDETCFVELAGGWDVNEDGRYETSDDGALARHPTRMPDDLVEMRAKCDVIMHAYGDRGGLAIAMSEDGQDRLYLEVEAGECGYLRLVKVVAGSPTQLGPDVAIKKVHANTVHELVACYDEGAGRLTGYVRVDALEEHPPDERGTHWQHAFTEVTWPAPVYAGFETTAVSTMEFDNFEMDRHGVDLDGCPECVPGDCMGFLGGFTEGPDLNCVWIEDAGDWFEDDGYAWTEDAGAVAHAQVNGSGIDPDGDEDLSQKVVMVLRSSEYLDEVGGIVDFLDVDNYHYALVKLASDAGETTLGNVRVFKRSGGTDSQLGAAMNVGGLHKDVDHLLEVCFDQFTDDVKVRVTPDWPDGPFTHYMTRSSSGHEGPLVGMRTGSVLTGTVRTTFGASYGTYSGECDDCEEAATCAVCVTSIGPNYLKAHIIGMRTNYGPPVCDLQPGSTDEEVGYAQFNGTYLIGPASCFGPGGTDPFGQRCPHPPPFLDTRMVWSKAPGTGLVPYFCVDSFEFSDFLVFNPHVKLVHIGNEWWLFCDSGNFLPCSGGAGGVIWGRLWKTGDEPLDCYDIVDFDLPFYCFYTSPGVPGDECDPYYPGWLDVANSFVRLNAI
jgi:hypothetical protein